MPCHFPLIAWRSRDEEDYNPATGKSKLVFREDRGWPNTRMELKCGQCAGCRLDRARQWAIRSIHEASLHEQNCFVTLTYDDEHLPLGGTLRPRDMQLFLKRLRRQNGFTIIRYLQCGEYGTATARPHHHLLLFGYRPVDLHFYRAGAHPLYTSPTLNDLWRHGNCIVGDISYDSACYTARYILAKINGSGSDDHYNGRIPEYITMSRRPGIGKGWYDIYKSDLYNTDKCVISDKFICKPPAYYDKIFAEDHALKFKQIKNKRKQSAASNPENTDERRQIKAELQQIHQSKLKRTYESTIPAVKTISGLPSPSKSVVRPPAPKAGPAPETE